MSKCVDGSTTYEWDGDLEEMSVVTVTRLGVLTTVKAHQLISQTNGQFLEIAERAGVLTDEPGQS